jgi:hypothetical protein
MTVGAGGNYGNLTNKAGSAGKNVLDARQMVDTLSAFINTASTSATGCVPKYHDILENFPRWVRDRDPETNLPEFLQTYYDWLYCKNPNGSGYFVNSDDFLSILNLDTPTIDILRSYMSSYAPDFPSGKIGNYEGSRGITLDNLVNFLENVGSNFYQQKGTEESYKYFFKTLYGTTLGENSIDYPKKKILRLNGGRFSSWGRGVSSGGTGSYEETQTLGGSYLNNSIFQDGYFYQDFSYIVNTGKVSDYDDLVLSMLHPSGLKVFFEQSFDDYVPIGGSGDYSEESDNNQAELTRIFNYLPYAINATGDLAFCVGCSGSYAGVTYFNKKGLTGQTWDQPTYNHPGWAFGSTTGTSGDIDTYSLEFSGITLSQFLTLKPPYGTTSPNTGISACNDLECATAGP